MAETLWYQILICLIAGAGAGIGTGFAGMSAAVVISPMLIAFLDIPAYQAVGIALASDVLASAVSAYTYKKNNNLDIKNALVLMGIVLVFTLVGSYLGKLVPNKTLGGLSEIMTALLGLKFIIWPTTATRESMKNVSKKRMIIQTAACGVYIGLVCGFMGAGGGMMMLMALTLVMGYELKTAVGTSVFVMSFTALTGSVSHIVIGGVPSLFIMALCIVFTLVFARVAAVLANKASNKVLNRITGIILVVISAGVLITEYVIK